MTLGPPPSAAGPSGNTPPSHGADNATSTTQNAQAAAAPTNVPQPAPSAPGPSISTGPYTSQFSVQPQPASRPYYANPATNAYANSYPAATSHASPQQAPQHSAPGGHYPPHANYYSQHPHTQGAPQVQGSAYPYYNYSQNAWANAWNTGTYQYGASGSYSYPYTQTRPAPQQPVSNASAPAQHPPQKQTAPEPPPKRKIPTPTPSPPPSPPPEYHKDWDAVIKSFLSSIGFTQALRGFEADMVILNPEYERKKVPGALGDLMKGLLRLAESKSESESAAIQGRPLDERKLDYVHLADGNKPRSQTSITKDISRFLAQNRARNDASNRNEFLLSLAEKRRRLNASGDSAPAEPVPSCARTDAKTQNRDLQMKYDIAKNEDGPLRRTLKSGAPAHANGATSASTDNLHGPIANGEVPSAERYPALDERLQNIEKHLAVRYVPSPPRSLLDRLKFLEEHIIHLEKEYPPWAALHFNQPRRGWPPPPRPTPIIVPSHLTASTDPRPIQQTASDTQVSATTPTTSTALASGSEAPEGTAKGKAKPGRNTKSSLHRAVMERLEVQKAINDFAGGDGG
ncbi:hypothetical protein ONZ51_g1986 [Trametes cubensis]|uniref:Uncharacterized protein n=1 Tax=Trametes cubensis TaxID=1111947 RepID=A0AAD7XEC4_9APHY|nr:hypothetical protein ONZ51_g1986 [Trametes cubensis]